MFYIASIAMFLYQISWIFVINQVPCVSSCWGRRHTRVICNERLDSFVGGELQCLLALDQRKRVFPMHSEQQVFLFVNKRLWNIKNVDNVIAKIG